MLRNRMWIKGQQCVAARWYLDTRAGIKSCGLETSAEGFVPCAASSKDGESPGAYKQSFAEQCNLILSITALDCSPDIIVHNPKVWAHAVHQRCVSSLAGFAAAIELPCLTAVGVCKAYPRRR